MGNKKGNLLIVVLVILVVLVIVIDIFIYLQKDDSDIQIVELSNNENNLNQFDSKFYELEDIAIEYREYKNIKNYKEFDYDFDGDGVTDKIRLSYKKEMVSNGFGEYNEEHRYLIEFNGEIISEGTGDDRIYIVDLNGNDKNTEVVIFDDGICDDPNYTIFSQNGNEMVKLKNIGGYLLQADEEGIILVKNIYNGITTPDIYFKYYMIRDGKLEEKNIDVEKIKDIELTSSHLYFSENYENANKLFSLDAPNGDAIRENLKILGIELLDENISFKIKEFMIEEDNEYDGFGYKIYVELSDGRKGYVFHLQLAG